jgi:hypothetical protein
MTKDKALEELFLAQQPHFDDQADFMAMLTRRLDAVEYVRRHQEATLRRYKLAMAAAFVVGLVSGALTLAFILSEPADVPLFTVRVQSGLLLWLAQNSRLLSATVLALLLSFGTMSIIRNVHDILRMRHTLSGTDVQNAFPLFQ